MPSIACGCGRRIDFGAVPNPDEWLLISDVAYDAVSGSVDAEDLYRKSVHMLRCPSCDRIWIFWDGFSGAPKEYQPTPSIG